MPRHVISPGQRPSESLDLVDRLAAELKSANGTQPVILEEQISATGSRHVHVIWDKWQNISDEQRSRLIVDAYRRAEGENVASEITIAVGVTPEDALSLGLLPFMVQPVHRRSDRRSMEEYQKAIEAELPGTLLGRTARQLRYATLEDAEDARRRLERALPESHWAVVQEVGGVDDWNR